MLRRAGSIVVVGFLLVLMVPSAGLAGGGCHGSSETTTGKGAGKVVVDIAQCGYSPTILYVEPGTEVRWTNMDPMPHTVTGMGASLGGITNIESGNKTEPYRFDDVGVYPYYCFLHPGMAAAVVVGDVSADKAAAEEQSLPVAVPVAGDQAPPTTPVKSESSNVVAVSIALAALAAAGAFVFGRRRKEREPQPA